MERENGREFLQRGEEQGMGTKEEDWSARKGLLEWASAQVEQAP